MPNKKMGHWQNRVFYATRDKCEVQYLNSEWSWQTISVEDELTFAHEDDHMNLKSLHYNP